MKNSLIIFPIILFGFSINVVSQSDTIVDSITYNLIERDSLNKIKVLGNLNNKGKKHGQFTIYNDEGKACQKGEYVKGKRNGNWWEYGWRGEYKNGKKIGKWWSDSNRLSRTYRFGKVWRQMHYNWGE